MVFEPNNPLVPIKPFFALMRNHPIGSLPMDSDVHARYFVAHSTASLLRMHAVDFLVSKSFWVYCSRDFGYSDEVNFTF